MQPTSPRQGPKDSSGEMLHPHARYRRESFGGALLHPTSKATRFLNHSGAVLVESLAGQPPVTQQVVARLQLSGRSFLHELRDDGFVTHPAIGSGQASLYFTDRTAFVADRLASPIGVEFELTLRCRRRCSYCAYESSPRVNTDGDLSTEQVIAALGQLEQAGVFYVRFTGGDPLLRHDVITILRSASTLGFGVSIASDLTVLRDEDIEGLSGLDGLVALQTTLDGSTADRADRHRGRGNHRRVLDGIRRLTAAGIPVLVGTVLTRDNADDIYDTARVLSRFGKLRYWVSPLYTAGRARSLSHLAPTESDLKKAGEQFERAIADGLVAPPDGAWAMVTDGLSVAKRTALWRGRANLARSPDRQLRIDAQGRCYSSIWLKEFYGDEVYVGNILNADIVSMWDDDPLLNSLRAASTHHPGFGSVIDVRSIPDTQSSAIAT